MNKVTIDRELLEQVASEFEHDNDRYTLGRELRKVLDAPRQPEGDGLEVVAWQDAENQLYTTAERRVLHDWVNNGYPIVELCRLSDAQRAIAELREVNRIQLEIAEVHGAACVEIRKERDTLRQQLAERDATIERLEAGIPRIQEQSHQMRKLRDKLEGLLLDLWEYTHDPELEQRIEAALAEVKPCPESPAPTT